MELIKQEIARYTHKDVVFLIRTRATLADKFAIEQADIGRLVNVGGKLVRRVDAVKWGQLLVRQFVCGWEGVTQDGKPAEYSYETLESSFPADADDVLWTKLANFIAARVDIFSKEGKAVKNESPAQPDGSRGQTHHSGSEDKTPSIAVAATA